ncbi:MAG: basic amino acid ABC transporter substrate-binding protein [Actinomycetota bacterium]
MATRKARLLMGVLFSLVLVAGACAEEEPVEPGAGGETETESPAPEFTTLEEGVLQVGSCLDFAPFESVEGGDEVGFDVDLIEEMASRLGLEVEWVRADFDTIFTAVAGGEFDVVAAASTITEERAQIVDFSDPYYNSRQSLVVNTEETPDIAGVADIGEGDIIGVQRGTTGKAWAEDNLVPQGAEIRTFQGASGMFQDLAAGGVTAVVNDEPSSAEIIKDLPGLEIVEPIDTDEKYGFAFSQENPELTDAMNQVLAEVIADGTYQEIFQTYFPGVEVPPEFQPS